VREIILNWDQQIAAVIYGWRSPILTKIMLFITNLGSTVVIVILGLIMFLLIWRKWSKNEACRLVVTMLGGVILNNLLKIMIRRPRPMLMLPLVKENSYSFPSGHAMNATIFYLLVAVYIYKFLGKKKYKWIFVISLIFLVLLIGFSRVYLGVHYPSDVVSGILMGFLWLVIIRKSVK